MRLARAPPERRRRLGRGPALLRRSGVDRRGPSTASQTAWALLALHAAGERSHGARSAASAWLVATQRADGSWDEPQYTGTGFPSDYYINYHLYRLDVPDDGARPLPAPDGRRDDARPVDAPSDGGDARSRTRRSALPAAERGDGAGAGRELPGRQPAAAAARARAPARDLRLRAPRRRARRHARRAIAWPRSTGWKRELDRAYRRRRAEHPLLRAPAADAARVRAAARAVRAPDRGQPRRPARQPLRDLGAAARLLRAVGRPRRRARARRVRRGRRPRAIALSDSICTALQLAEHCQDVGRGPAPAGAIYLPLEDLARFGCSERGPRAPRTPSAPLRALLAFEVARARALLRARRAADRRAARRARGWPSPAFVAGGRAALDAIERAGYDVLAGAAAGRHAGARAGARCARHARRARRARR